MSPSSTALVSWLSGSIASLVSAIPLPWIVAAQVFRVGGGIFLVLWADGRLPWQSRAKVDWRSQSGLHLVPFWYRRPRRGAYDGGNDLSGAGASPCPRGAERPHFILSTGDGPHLRRPAGLDAPWPRSVAVEAQDRLDRPAGRGVMPLA